MTPAADPGSGSRRTRDIAARFRAALTGVSPVPLPGHGSTRERFERLAAVAEQDLAMARLVEGDADARAILSESGRISPDDDITYGVWAARSPSAELRAVPTADGWLLHGTKAFCSGSGVIDRALVTAEAPDGYRLFDVSTGDVVTSVVPDSWPAVGMADSASETLVIDGARLPASSAVGPPGFYTDRPGFWFGACGVAACWFGGARGLVRGVVRLLGPDPDQLVLAELGRQSAGLWAMHRLLVDVAAAIDADPDDRSARAQDRALALRQVVHDGCAALLASTAVAGGARPLCHDPQQARRAADLHVYLAQHHGPRDAVGLGQVAFDARRTWS